MTTYRIAVIPGDGIGREVVPFGLRAIQRAAEVTGSFRISTTDLDWSCERYLRTGSLMPSDWRAVLQQHDAIYFGAVGDPAVADHVSVWGLILPIRQQLDLYVNLRPIRTLDGIPSPLTKAPKIDMLFVRENCEGEYSGLGTTLQSGTPGELALQTAVYTRHGVERVARYAFELAQHRAKRLTSATKSNALQYTAVLWDRVVADVARDYPDVAWKSSHVDALAALFVTDPSSLDVVVGSNLYGDILTDLGAALQGSMGLAASANLDPSRRNPSLFEPIHGSAPTIAGQGIANPVAAVWAGAMLLEHLGETEAAKLIIDAIQQVCLAGVRTPDLGGTSTTSSVGQAIGRGIGQDAIAPSRSDP